MTRPDMPDYMVAARLEKVANKYDFSPFSCECGKVHDIEDFLRLAAAQLRNGTAERKGE